MNNEAGLPPAAPLEASPRTSSEASAEAATASIDHEAPSFYFSRKPRLQDLIAVLDRVIWLEIAIVYLLEYDCYTQIYTTVYEHLG
jgi:hypothetical protein